MGNAKCLVTFYIYELTYPNGVCHKDSKLNLRRVMVISRKLSITIQFRQPFKNWIFKYTCSTKGGTKFHKQRTTPIYYRASELKIEILGSCSSFRLLHLVK